MKVVSALTSPAAGGAEFAAVWLLDALAEQGHEAVLFTDVPDLCSGTRVAQRDIDLGPKLSRSTYPELLARSPVLASRFRRALAREAPYNTLLLHFKKEQLLTLALPEGLRRTCVWAEWGPLPHQFARGLPNAVYRAAARRADAILAVSSGTKATLVAAGVPEEKIAVIPNAVRVDEHRFSAQGRQTTRDRLGIPEQAFVVGVLSRFHPKKRNEVVIEAVKTLDPDVHVILAGEGPAEQELRNLAQPLGPRAHFVPSPGPEVSNVLSAFDVAVFCPSPTEGAPLAVILPMLAGRPVVSTGAEGARDLIRPGTGRILSPENDAPTLAAALDDYRRDPELRAREGRCAREHAEVVHSGAHVAAEFEELLARVSSDGAR